MPSSTKGERKATTNSWADKDGSLAMMMMMTTTTVHGPALCAVLCVQALRSCWCCCCRMVRFLPKDNYCCSRNSPFYFGLILLSEKGFASGSSNRRDKWTYQPNVETVYRQLEAVLEVTLRSSLNVFLRYWCTSTFGFIHLISQTCLLVTNC